MVFQELHDVVFAPLLYLYSIVQRILAWLLAPAPPAPSTHLSQSKRIAVIGAGLTGVSAASHCVGHGFDVVLFEAGTKDSVGGIWTRVNSTSGLQISSLMYRFQPSVQWKGSYPKQAEIVEQIRALWHRYGLEDKTRFETKVERVYKDKQGRWIINDPSYGRFAGVIAAIGTCAGPKMPKLPGQDKFKGEIYHSSELDGKRAKGKNVAIIGGGASAVEALEFVDKQEASIINVLARSEKWIIPRNPIVDALLSLNVFGQETLLSWIPENLLRIFFYRDLADIAPPQGSGKGIFTETPMVNSRVLELVRSGKAKWLRGDIEGLDETGVHFSARAQGVAKGGPGESTHVDADIIILATGYERPTLDFLPQQFFEKPYEPPNWYLQVFPPWDPTVCCNNCTYVNAIGTVGNYHIGIYTRFLLMYLSDPLAKPSEAWMKRWIGMTRLLKWAAPGGAFDFFTYGELLYWFAFVILVNPFRWKWAPFVLCGIGAGLPRRIVDGEDWLRDLAGVEGEEEDDEPEQATVADAKAEKADKADDKTEVKANGKENGRAKSDTPSKPSKPDEPEQSKANDQTNGKENGKAESKANQPSNGKPSKGKSHKAHGKASKSGKAHEQ